MKKKYEEMDEGLREYQIRKREVQKQLIPPIVFFIAIGLIILFSVVKHNQKLESGEAEIPFDAIRVDYMAAAVGLDIYHNTDELDDSYGDYFYIGADFYEVNKEVTIDVAGHLGTAVFEGDQMIESFTWKCDDQSFEAEELEEFANDLSVAYGDYTLDENGSYVWQASDNGKLGNNDRLKKLSCRFDEQGILLIEGYAD